MQENPSPASTTEQTRSYPVWDRPTRVLHWINAILLLGVAALGFLYMFREDLHIDGRPAKFALKYLHSVVGITLMFGFGARLLWAFRGNRFARFSSLRVRLDTPGAARREAAELASPGGGRKRLGHGPLGRLSATAMFGLLCVLLSTGLLRANTDLHFPPFGPMIAAHVAKPGVDLSAADPADKSWQDPGKMNDFSPIGNPAGKIHRVSAWIMVLLVVLHVSGVVFKELRQGGGVFSSMIVGRKVFRADEPVVDDD